MRLIDADQLITELEITIGEIYNEEIIRGIYTSIGTAKEQPTVEAKEVVHAKWIYNQNYTWECGNCGFRPFKGYIPKEPGFNYCPNCGASMRTSAE